MPFDVSTLDLHVTVSDGEGSGSVGVGWWRPRDAQHQTRVTRTEVPHAWRSYWKGLHKTVDINEVEAVGPVLALETWPALSNGLWIHFVDNTSAQGTLIKGSSSIRSLNRLTFWIWAKARQRRLYLWAERVASPDNPVDLLSRRDTTDHYGQGWVYDEPRLPWIEFGHSFRWSDVL